MQSQSVEQEATLKPPQDKLTLEQRVANLENSFKREWPKRNALWATIVTILLSCSAVDHGTVSALVAMIIH